MIILVLQYILFDTSLLFYITRGNIVSGCIVGNMSAVEYIWSH
jgi:hypothetical protein